jgi:membrane associated rhomboid family serine protease
MSPPLVGFFIAVAPLGDLTGCFCPHTVAMPSITPLNKALILINVAVFGLQYLLGGLVDVWFALWPPQAERFGYPGFQVWQLVTYGFMHGSLMHLFFNMFALFMFGSDIERLFGAKRYLIYYLVCVVGAALMHLIVVTAAGQPPLPMVGASGGVFGLLLAFGMAFPKRTLMLIFPPIPMPAWLFVTLYGIFELYMGITQTASGVAHFAHLGGMATGFVLIRYWRAQRSRPR